MNTIQDYRTQALRRALLPGLCSATAAVSLLFTDPVTAQQAPPEPTAPSKLEQAGSQLSPATIRMIQHSLIQGGYRIEAADGVWGPSTAAAIREFQRVKGLQATGLPDSQTLAALGVQASGAAGAGKTGPAPIQTRSPADLDPATIRAIQQALDKQGLQVGPVDGVWGEQTTTAIANLQRAHGMPASGLLDAHTLAVLGLLPSGEKRPDIWRSGRTPGPEYLDPAAIRLIQRALQERGFGVGTVDGIWGDRTVAAIREFQRRQGIEPLGEPDVYTLAALGLLPGSQPMPADRSRR